MPAHWRQRPGSYKAKHFSYNNIADSDAALECVKQFAERQPALSSSTPILAASRVAERHHGSLRQGLQD